MKRKKSSNSYVINQNGHLLQTFDESFDTSSLSRMGVTVKKRCEQIYF